MTRPGVTIDATVLAAPIGIDRVIETDIGRVVGGDDRARVVDFDRHRNAVGQFFRIPAVVDAFQFRTVEASGRIRQGAAPFQRFFSDEHATTVRAYSEEIDPSFGARETT